MKPIISAIAAVFTVFLLFAFVQWNAYPGSWSSDARYFMSCLSLIFGGVVFFASKP